MKDTDGIYVRNIKLVAFFPLIEQDRSAIVVDTFPFKQYAPPKYINYISLVSYTFLVGFLSVLQLPLLEEV